ncbi:MAG: hypothetical protein KIT84_18720 [Labilithrix sp.]|nr:hypothetical protein [Labilithrix sp.]MCW5813068.1 hypothetical protein [Labilithrix sp.]
MIGAGRFRGLVVMGACATFVVACDKRSPNPAAGAPVGSATSGTSGTSELDRLCGTTPPAACGADPTTEYGAPQLHVDACKLGGAARAIAEWPQVQAAPSRPTLASFGATSSGGVYCPAALGGRPAVVFERHGFTLPAAAAASLDSASGNFTLVAVMRYAGTKTPLTEASGIVFQRNEPAAPHFKGPQLGANFAFAAAPGGTDLVRTDRLGISLQFGTEGGVDATRSVSAVTTARVVGPIVVTARRAGATLELRVNGALVKRETIPGSFSGGGGNGQPVNVGRTGGENNYFDGALGELVYWNESRPDAAVVALEKGLRSKWGLP